MNRFPSIAKALGEAMLSRKALRRSDAITKGPRRSRGADLSRTYPVHGEGNDQATTEVANDLSSGEDYHSTTIEAANDPIGMLMNQACRTIFFNGDVIGGLRGIGDVERCGGS